MKLLLLIPILFMFAIVPAHAEMSSYVGSEYYEFGDELEFVVNIDNKEWKELVKIEIDNGETRKLLGGYANWGKLQIGLPLTEKNGWTTGVYDITFSYNGESQTHQFGIDALPEKFTLYGKTNIYTLNDYALFFGQVQGYEIKDRAYSSSVLVEILDSNGKLLEDNWTSTRNNLKGDNALATKSSFRANILTSGFTQIYEELQEREKFEENNIPLWDNGYRFVFKVDPITYKSGETYTVKVQHQNLVQTYDFLVLDDHISPLQGKS